MNYNANNTNHMTLHEQSVTTIIWISSITYWDIVQSLKKVSIQKGLMEVEMNSRIQAVSITFFKTSSVVSYQYFYAWYWYRYRPMQYVCVILKTCCYTNSPMKDVPTTTTCLPAAASATALASSGALITCTPGRPPPGIPSFRGLQINRSDQTCMDAEIYFTTIIENMHLPGQGTSHIQVTLICIALASIKYRIN